MRKRWKRFIIAILILVFILTQAGCGDVRELNSLVIVMGIGLDKDTEDPGNILLTSQVVLPEKIGQGSSTGGTSGSSEKPYCNVESAAENTFEAIREYTHIICSKLYISHNQIFVIGKDIAEAGIRDYMDFFVRAKETRPTTTIVISNTTASAVLDVEPKANLLPAININKLVEAQVNNSQSIDVNVQDYVSTMLSESTELVAPLISIETQGENELLSVKGLAVFKDDKMVGELDEDETRGLLWIRGDVETGAINVTYNDQIISTEIKSATTKVSPEIKDEKIIMHIQVAEEGVLTMQSGETNVATNEDLLKISDCVKDVIEEEITIAFEQAKQLGCDIFGFGEMLNKYKNEQWENIKDNWDNLFKTVELDIKIETNISSAGAITKPVTQSEGDQS